jgi:hypothetical protein
MYRVEWVNGTVLTNGDAGLYTRVSAKVFPVCNNSCLPINNFPFPDVKNLATRSRSRLVDTIGNSRESSLIRL